ncbi:hypothetical protein CCP3SC1_290036 [Gammaproteobacteria bacterium]
MRYARCLPESHLSLPSVPFRLAALNGHGGPVYGCAFSPDGRTLLSSSGDSSLRLWEVTSGKELRQWRTFPNSAWACLELSENRVITTGGEAWRWLGWQAVDPETGSLVRYPAEVFGALPGNGE